MARAQTAQTQEQSRSGADCSPTKSRSTRAADASIAALLGDSRRVCGGGRRGRGCEGIRSAGVKATSPATQPPTDKRWTRSGTRPRSRSSAAGGTTPMAMPTPGAVAVIPIPRDADPAGA